MPRRRIIDPEFWQDTLMATLPLGARLLYVGTWNHADDAGILELDPKRIKSAVFPHDERIRIPDLSKWLEQLVDAGRLLPYEVNGRRYAVIARFHRHQKVEKPTRSRLPRPPEAVLERLDPKHRQAVIERSDPAHVWAARKAQEPEQTASPSGEESPNGGGTLGEESGSPRSQVKRSEEKRSKEKEREENARARAGEELRSGATTTLEQIAPEARIYLELTDLYANPKTWPQERPLPGKYADGRVRDREGNVHASTADFYDWAREEARKRAAAADEHPTDAPQVTPSSEVPY